MSTQPLNRWEKFMAKIAGQDVDIQPLNRQEQFYDEIAQKTDAALTPTITEPSDGDVIKYDATNGKWVNGEGGGSGGGGALVVGVTYDESTDTSTCDKTWAEINAAVPLVYVIYNRKSCPLSEIRPGGDGEAYSVSFYNLHSGVEMSFSTESENGYPSTAQD